MRTVRQLLDDKGRSIYSIDPDQMMYAAIVEMAERSVGALLVMQDDKLVGIVSERDYARKIILKGKSSRDTPVRDVMTSQLFTTGENATVDSCMRQMSERRIRHLPVMDEDKVVGMLSIGDLVKAVISDQQFEIEQLSHYIAG